MLTDDKSVILTQKEFDDLPEYTISLPTGTFIGKQWKRDMEWCKRGWVMGEYTNHPDPNLVGIIWRDIFIV